MPADPVDAGLPQPTDIKLRRAEQQLRIQWRDGHCSELSAATLRRNCPCATCRGEREKQSQTALPVLDTVDDPQLIGAELVGQYAIRLDWSDGHNTGIFDYRLLRSLGQ